MIMEKALLFYRKIRAIRYWRHFKKDGEVWTKTIVKDEKQNKKYEKELNYLRKNGAEYFPYEWAKRKHIMSIHGGGLRGGSCNKP